MAEVIKMPKMSDTMTEGVLAKWHKKVGDKVKSGDVLAEVETDKATMDMESYWDGTLLYIGVEEGTAVPVDAVMAVIGKEGEDYKAALEAEKGGAEAESEKPKAESTDAPKTEDKKEEAAPAQGGGLGEEELAEKGVTVIRMPLLSDTMTEGVIAEWHKKVGDKVKDDDVLADVETDKATMEVMGYATGTLLHIGVEKGSAAKVNGIIAIVGPEGTDVSGILAGGSAPAAKAETKEEAPKEEKQTTTADAGSSAPVAEGSSDSRVKASPLAKKIAKDKGIDLSQVAGSAEGGRIIKKDIENYKPAAQAESGNTKAESAPAVKAQAAAPVIPTFVGEVKFTEQPVSQMRKVIAKRLAESLFTAPHFYLTVSIDMDNAMAARTAINEVAPVKVSFNDIVIKAVAVALKKHPAVNSSWGGDKIRFNEHTNIGVAMAVEDGLLVPVVRFADGKSLSHISAEVKDFGGKAKAKKLQPADWEGSTFTVSNLGMFGIDEFTSIINSPDGAILSVGAIQQVPVVKNGAVVPGNVMKLTLGCDHRVVDGATGAQFLQTLKGLLEEPIRLLA
ncbi:pyruvate dehydrogenase E2 component (dihydrolipoamide acetyltransferase) [Pedobacter psychrotolerans]|uniref:Dihydrolipoamide acetyltransferase component of pyruvate dehydrogenase complex n=1 Tax=Pedobacter psychrotolerans TaxID=1843235 RepID=A0A4R2HFP3_9SPHI|nr:pyruvate dehydrogenase complex dihydrolipoamide acetyltransferase [Pedobacter psychrotolerans]TCO27240.1 pyruvate dehydrogenase E2 component (dihydrolipoamide acetyltransferase) [Pedobacter psychrotolerans]GGE60057.1 dihydrolipoamide acetyltransferase component of pyruvate dehydrogenase complex [Pedobacter psychrotolerans]